MSQRSPSSILFFFNDTATTEIYTLSLHDALPISQLPETTIAALVTSVRPQRSAYFPPSQHPMAPLPTTANVTSAASPDAGWAGRDRKSTRLNSSHGYISYAVFCLKKKKNPGLRQT